MANTPNTQFSLPLPSSFLNSTSTTPLLHPFLDGSALPTWSRPRTTGVPPPPSPTVQRFLDGLFAAQFDRGASSAAAAASSASKASSPSVSYCKGRVAKVVEKQKYIRKTNAAQQRTMAKLDNDYERARFRKHQKAANASRAEGKKLSRDRQRFHDYSSRLSTNQQQDEGNYGCNPPRCVRAGAKCVSPNAWLEFSIRELDQQADLHRSPISKSEMRRRYHQALASGALSGSRDERNALLCRWHNERLQRGRTKFTSMQNSDAEHFNSGMRLLEEHANAMVLRSALADVRHTTFRHAMTDEGAVSRWEQLFAPLSFAHIARGGMQRVMQMVKECLNLGWYVSSVDYLINFGATGLVFSVTLSSPSSLSSRETNQLAMKVQSDDANSLEDVGAEVCMQAFMKDVLAGLHVPRLHGVLKTANHAGSPFAVIFMEQVHGNLEDLLHHAHEVCHKTPDTQDAKSVYNAVMFAVVANLRTILKALQRAQVVHGDLHLGNIAYKLKRGVPHPPRGSPPSAFNEFYSHVIDLYLIDFMRCSCRSLLDASQQTDQASAEAHQLSVNAFERLQTYGADSYMLWRASVSTHAFSPALNKEMFRQKFPGSKYIKMHYHTYRDVFEYHEVQATGNVIEDLVWPHVWEDISTSLAGINFESLKGDLGIPWLQAPPRPPY